MRPIQKMIQCSVVAIVASGCTMSHLATTDTAESTLSMENRADLERLSEGLEKGSEVSAVVMAPLKEDDRAVKLTAEEEKKFTVARPELLVPDAVAHKPASHGMHSSRQLMRFQPVRTTAYNHDENDHLGYGKKTASGEYLEYGSERSAAADWSRYPLGTRFCIVGDFDDCEYVVNDYGSALVGTNTIDLYKPTNNEMKRWGVRDVVIEVIEWGSFTESAQIMRSRTKWRHVKTMVTSIDDNQLTKFDGSSVEAIADSGAREKEALVSNEAREVAKSTSKTETEKNVNIATY